MEDIHRELGETLLTAFVERKLTPTVLKENLKLAMERQIWEAEQNRRIELLKKIRSGLFYSKEPNDVLVRRLMESCRKLRFDETFTNGAGI